MWDEDDKGKTSDKPRPRPNMKVNIKHWFTYHPPTPDQVDQYTKLRAAAEAFALVIEECTPSCADQTAAIRKVREAVMTANAAIACEGR